MKKFFLFAAVAAIGLFACKNQSEMLDATDSSVRSKAPVSKDIRYFDDYEQLSKEIDKTANMSFDELCKYEASIGFNSFGKISDLAYNEIAENEEIYKSVEEVRDAITKYPEYLLLAKDEKEDYTLETKLENSPYQYIVNKEQMFQVKDTLIKVLRDVEIFASVERYELLRNLDEAEIERLTAEAEKAPASYDCEFLYEFVCQLPWPFYNVKVHIEVYECDGVIVPVYAGEIPHVPQMKLGRGFELEDYNEGSDGRMHRMRLKMTITKSKYKPSQNEFKERYYFSNKTHRKTAGVYYRFQRDVGLDFEVYAANTDCNNYWHLYNVSAYRHHWNTCIDPYFFYGNGEYTAHFEKTRGYIKTYGGTPLYINLDLDNTY